MQPLSRHGLEELIAARSADEWVDLRGYDLTRADLRGMCLERVVFGSRDGEHERPAAELRTTYFSGCELVGCKLARVVCVETDFRGAKLRDCDFRYASFARASFADATLVGCDFYRATFEHGVVFENAVLKCVSLNKASLGGIVGMGRASLEPRDVPALVQEDEERYSTFLQRTIEDRPNDVRGALAHRLDEAALTYRALSAMWSGQGFFADAAWAYVRAKKRERAAASPTHRSTSTRPLRWLGLTLAEVLCLFGEGLGRVLGWIAVVALLPGVLYSANDLVEHEENGADAGLADCLLFSVGRMAASTPERLSAATPLTDWIGVAQTFLGIALLGLLGFVLGNKLRSS